MEFDKSRVRKKGMRLIDGDSINFESNEFDTYNDYLTAFDAIDKAPTIDLWHYPSKGEYPDEDGEYLFLVRAFSSIHRVVGDYEVLKNQRHWYAEIADHCIADEPIAWMPLPEPPKDIT